MAGWVNLEQTPSRSVRWLAMPTRTTAQLGTPDDSIRAVTFDTTLGAEKVWNGSAWRSPAAPVYVLSTAGTAHTNTTDEGVLASYDIPANTIQAGTMVKVSYQGIATTTVGTTTLTIRLRLGPTTLTGTALITTSAVDVADNDIFLGEFTLVGRAAPSATSACVGYGRYTDPGTAGTVAFDAGYLASTNFATNGILKMELTADWSAADASSCRADVFIVEIL